MKNSAGGNRFASVILGVSVFNLLTTTSPSRAATVSLPAQNRGSGVEWNLVWSNPNQEGHLGVGGSVFGQTGQTSTQLRFDVTPLKGAYSKINSATIRLTQGSTDWSQSFPRFGGTIEAYRLRPADAEWNNDATFGYPDKNVDMPWAGGESGALVPDTDYDPTLLAQTAYADSPEGAPVAGTNYDLVISGALATTFIDPWSSGVTNEGFVLWAAPSPQGDNRLFIVPEGTGGPTLIVDYVAVTGLVAIITQPTNVTVGEGGAASFSVSATGAPPLRYQWLRNGDPISGATSAQLAIARVPLDDNGARFSVRVTDAAETTLTSQEALLMVIADTTPPTVLAARGIDITTVNVVYSEPVSAASAEATNNYRVSGDVTIVAAKRVDDSTVVLTTSQQTLKATYTLTINGIRDQSAATNQIATDTQVTFTTPTPRVAFTAQNRASGVSWNTAFSNPNDEGHLAVGFAGTTSRTSSQLRFDVRSLNNVFSEINSVTVRLTHGFTGWSIGRAMGNGTLFVHRLKPENASWNDSGTFGTRNGTTAWAGGESGALVPDTDYDPTVLAMLEYTNNPTGADNPVGRIYELVIPGALASGFVNQWIAGGVNEGLLLRAERIAPTGDTRLLLFHAGTNAPTLIVDYTPLPNVLVITQDLADLSVGQGDPATLTIGVKGAPPFKYQWYRGSTPIEGATSSALTLASVASGDNGAEFSVQVTDAANSKVTSRPAKLTVTAPIPRMVFDAKDRASGVQWGLGFSNANDENHLAVGSRVGANQSTSTQLRFDVTALRGLYSRINSMTIRLTQGFTGWSGSFTRYGGTIQVYRLAGANADWTSNGTFGTKDGTNSWAGGESGALQPTVDYAPTLLATAAYETIPAGTPHVATVYELVIPGDLATPIIDQWASAGAANEGFLLRADPSQQGDNRSLFVPDGADGPKLIVDFTRVGSTGPSLNFVRSGNQLTFTWTDEGFVLQQNPDLSNPNGWSNVAGGDQSPVNVTINGSSNDYYRLRKP